MRKIACRANSAVRHFKSNLKSKLLFILAIGIERMLVGIFYTLQGFGNLLFGLLVKGGLGGVGYIMEIAVKGFLVFASCLSLVTALLLFLRRENWARVFGIVSSVLLGLFYFSIAFGIAEFFAFGIAQQVAQQYYSATAGLLLSVAIVFLNVVSVIFLNRIVKNKNV